MLPMASSPAASRRQNASGVPDPPGKRQARPTMASGSCLRSWDCLSSRFTTCNLAVAFSRRARISADLSEFVVMEPPHLPFGQHNTEAGAFAFLGRVGDLATVHLR